MHEETILIKVECYSNVSINYTTSDVELLPALSVLKQSQTVRQPFLSKNMAQKQSLTPLTPEY